MRRGLQSGRYILTNRDMIKAAIDGVPTACLDGLYLIVTAMQELTMPQPSKTQETWEEFLGKTYGSLADAPIERADQGNFEKRESWS